MTPLLMRNAIVLALQFNTSSRKQSYVQTLRSDRWEEYDNGQEGEELVSIIQVDQLDVTNLREIKHFE